MPTVSWMTLLDRLRNAAETWRGWLRGVSSGSELRPKDLFDGSDIAALERAQVLVAITFHFAEQRLTYLEDVLRSLAAFAVQRKHIVIYTNSGDASQHLQIGQAMTRAGLKSGADAEIIAENSLPHPFELTWCHKRLIADVFRAKGSLFTHFIYLEDDERLTFENFAYFVAAREHLKPHGLIPAYVRTEWSLGRACHVNTDSPAPTSLRRRCFVRVAGAAFINLDYPYCGAFILDQELAREYVASPAFDREQSKAISPFEVRERAAMGLTFSSPPSPFTCRAAIPVLDNGVPQAAWLAHLPDNYAQDPASPFGKIAMSELIQDELDPAFESGRPGAAHLRLS